MILALLGAALMSDPLAPLPDPAAVAVAAPPLVRRGDAVTIRFTDGALLIRAGGKALNSGAAGASVRVLPAGARQAVEGRVSGPGEVTLHP